MRVLMVNSPAALKFRGGDLVQMRQTARALRAFGVTVAESFDREPAAAGFDLAHVFNLRTVDVVPDQVYHLKKAGLPVVLSPIYLDPAVPLWATQVTVSIFGGNRPPEEIDRLLGEFQRRELKAQLPDGTVLAADAPNRPTPGYDVAQREALRQVDCLLPNSLLEMDHLVRTLRIPPPPFAVVPYGVDALTFLDPDPEPFVRKYGLRDFVLQAGRIEPSKNQLLHAHALRDAGLQLVLAGGCLQPNYVAWCKKYGPKDLVLLPHLEPAELAGAYAAARVHVLPSWIETCGLVTLEAALAGCSVVASNAGCELEYLENLASYCDPADVGSIRAAVTSAWQSHKANAGRRLELKRRILHEFTWENAAAATFRAYSRVLAR
jgi:glycosyltransferase involved in cell wall biosynthesis